MITTTLGPHTVEIVFEDMALREGLKGQARFDDLRIRLDKSLTGTRLAETFVHECLHLAADATGTEPREETVTSMGLFLSQLLAPWIDLSPLERK
ncbi:MAG TPA: hypothetical protein ENH33_00590 [Actinobacteria bacterium]|nr:hypothetical protein [Actinomycetota bacterium]